MHSTLFRRVSAGLTMLLLSGMASATDWLDRSNENLRPGVTEASQQIYHLHNLVLIIVTLIGVLVVGLMFYSMYRHRRSANPNPSKFHENIFLEVMWTVIPFVILIGMAIPATRVLIYLDDTSDSELTVMVTGYRWNWSYEYLTYEDDNDINVFFFSNLATPREQYFNPVLSGGLFPHGTAQDLVGQEAPEKDHLYQLEVDKHLVIPSGQKVRFLITADDVIHSFWVPDFGGKKDAIPGFVNETWALVPEGEEGMYYGQCAELCGRNHAFMPIAVEVVTQDEFRLWLDEEKAKAADGPDLTPFATMDDAMEIGGRVYAGACAVCHGDNGQGGIGPAFAGTDYATKPEFLNDHIEIMINGRGAMPSFSAQLSSREIAAVVTYERNAWGNDSGDLVQPADVEELK